MEVDLIFLRSLKILVEFLFYFFKSNLEEIALAFSSTPTAQVPPEDVFLMICSIPLGRSVSLRRKRFFLTKRNKKGYSLIMKRGAFYAKNDHEFQQRKEV